MADTVLGKVSCVPRGDYNAGTTYYALDIVGYNGGSYLAMKEVTGVTPSNDQVNWMQLSGPGLPGADGTDGTDGVTFTPSVSEAGVISWTNDGEEENPDPVDIMGPPGAAAGFGTVSATVDETTGTPSVEVETSGPDTAKNISFAFSGLKGEKGDKGDKGDTGDTGPQGPEGQRGPKGDTGTGLDILGTYASLEELQGAVQSPSQGDMYNVGTIAPYTIYMWDTTDGAGAWESQGQLQGPRGEQGPQGDPGPEGPQGPAGSDGAPGAQGPAGENGGYYSPTVDTSGNLTWAASKEGMPAVSGTNIRGPQGKQGPRGPAGQDGAQGPAGQDGAQGPEGPQGPKGDPGDPGPQGPSGDIGPQGPAGAAATITVGTVTTGEPGSQAQVVNAGTSNAAVLNFTIPRGSDGARGPRGPQGPKGDPGDTNFYVATFTKSGQTYTCNRTYAQIDAQLKAGVSVMFFLSDRLVTIPAGYDILSSVIIAHYVYPSIMSGDEVGWFRMLSVFIDSSNTVDVVTRSVVGSGTDLVGSDYTVNRPRGMSFQSSTPSSIPNGCSVGVYE